MNKYSTAVRTYKKIFTCIGCTAVFSAAFTLCAFSTKKLVTINAPQPKSLNEILIEFEQPEVVTPDQYHKVVANHEKKDQGLIFYRNSATRNYVTWFYGHVTGDKEIARIILKYADENDIPISLAFALAHQESRYHPRANNYNNNSSIDRGLFQLNSRSFVEFSEEEFFDPKINAQHGLAYFRDCLDVAGNEVAALAMYNAGRTKVRNGGTPQRTLNYIAQISNYRDGLDELFKREVVEKLKNSADDSSFTIAALSQ